MSQIIEFLLQYKFVIAFYITILLIITINKKKFDFQAKFIALYRTKVGLKLMNKLGTKYREFVKLLGVIGIGIGFVGMAYIFVYVLNGFVKLFTVPNAPATFSLVLPGVHIPGSAIFIPFWHGIIALFIVVVVHEFGHGVVARANKIPVLNSGIVFFGPLIGAFVEPDEKKLSKETDVAKYSVYAAGPFANALLAIVAIAIVSLVLSPFVNSLVTSNGFSFVSLQEDMPAMESGLMPEVVYNTINDIEVFDANEFVEVLSEVEPGETVTIGNSTNTYTLVTTESPVDSSRGYIGVLGINTAQEVNEGIAIWFVDILKWLETLMIWIFMLSLGLGAANLLPLGPVDGGRMVQLAFKRIFGDKKGHKVWVRSGLMLFFIILVLIFFPIMKAII